MVAVRPNPDGGERQLQGRLVTDAGVGWRWNRLLGWLDVNMPIAIMVFQKKLSLYPVRASSFRRS